MAIVRWQPLNDLSGLQSDMNRLFNSFFDSPGGRNGSRWAPPMDLVEADDHFLLTADLPGLSEDDVKIEVDDRTLTISGERRIEHKSDGDNYYRLERSSGSFSRAMTLPEGVDPEQITARFDKGVLEVRVPKPEPRQAKRVAIQVGDAPPQIEQE